VGPGIEREVEEGETAGFQHGPGIGMRAGRPDIGLQLMLGLFEHRMEDRLLIGEMMIEGALGQLGGAGDVVDRRRGIAPGPEQRAGGIHQFGQRGGRAFFLRSHRGRR
jgi:hypothetical protein